MADRLDEFMRTKGKQYVGQMVTSMMSGLTSQVTELTEAQKLADTRLAKADVANSEVRECPAAAEGREIERDERTAQRIIDLQEAIERMRVGTCAWASASSAGSGARQSGAPGRRGGTKSEGDGHIVLPQFAEPMLWETMRGLEASSRSTHCPQEEVRGTASQTFYSDVAIKFHTYEAAVAYTATLKGRFRDPAGREVEIIYKGAKAGRPPRIVWRGEMPHRFYGIFETCRSPNEERQQHHAMRGVTCMHISPPCPGPRRMWPRLSAQSCGRTTAR